jgi:hypothetical protein
VAVSKGIFLSFQVFACWRRYFVLLCGLILGGCANNASPLGQSIALVFSPTRGAPSVPESPDPRYSFLRVEIAGYPPSMLALGFIDPHPQGPVLVWYSANGQVLRTQNGRIVGTTGAPVDWSALRWLGTPPAWNAISVDGYRYARERDVLPGYQFGIREEVRGASMPVPSSGQLPSSLPQDVAQQLHWYREVVTSSTVSESLPPAVFAWGQYAGEWMVVYSEQCLSPALCLKLQRWPVRKEAVQ